LASPLFFYAFVLWEHALSIGLVVSTTYLAVKKRALGAGALAAFALWFRPETILLVPALVLAVLVAFGISAGTRFILRFSIGYLICITPWWLYNFLSFGNPWVRKLRRIQ
jgi:Gpi18-like mannosyltransferase